MSTDINNLLDDFIYFNNENYSVPLRPNLTGRFIRWYFKGGHLSSPTGFSGVRVTPSIVWCVCFVDRCLSFCPFSFGHCVVCPSSIYGFWLPLWYLQTLLVVLIRNSTWVQWPIICSGWLISKHLFSETTGQIWCW